MADLDPRRVGDAATHEERTRLLICHSGRGYHLMGEERGRGQGQHRLRKLRCTPAPVADVGSSRCLRGEGALMDKELSEMRQKDPLAVHRSINALASQPPP
jgi:hypothetical protein